MYGSHTPNLHKKFAINLGSGQDWRWQLHLGLQALWERERERKIEEYNEEIDSNEEIEEEEIYNISRSESDTGHNLGDHEEDDWWFY